MTTYTITARETISGRVIETREADYADAAEEARERLEAKWRGCTVEVKEVAPPETHEADPT